jgi:hypothetical protein
MSLFPPIYSFLFIFTIVAMASPVSVAFQPSVASVERSGRNGKLPSHVLPKPSVIKVDVLPLVSSPWSDPSAKLWDQEDGLTFLLAWKNGPSGSNARQVARATIANLWPWFANPHNSFNEEADRKAAMCTDLMISMKAFESFCQGNFDDQFAKEFKGKLAILHGAGATRCPSWHGKVRQLKVLGLYFLHLISFRAFNLIAADYVPCRWIQTFCGPGTLYIDPLRFPQSQSVLEQIIRGPHRRQRGSKAWKDRLIKTAGIEPEQAQEGEAILLVGHRWKEALRSDHKDDHRAPVLHRSPRSIPKKQARVILTLDVEAEDEERCSKGCCNQND